MRILRAAVGVFMWFLCIGSIFCVFDADEPIAFALIAATTGFCGYILCFKKESERESQNQRGLSNDEAQYKPLSCDTWHVNGLPIAENVRCAITQGPDEFVFLSGNMRFELEKSKIVDMCIKTDTEIQQQYVSSIGGAVAGACLFGPVGAIIGGRAKKKKVKNEVHSYLIITYQSDSEIKYIGFEICSHILAANQFVDDFRKSHATTTTYKL